MKGEKIFLLVVDDDDDVDDDVESVGDTDFVVGGAVDEFEFEFGALTSRVAPAIDRRIADTIRT